MAIHKIEQFAQQNLLDVENSLPGAGGTAIFKDQNRYRQTAKITQMQ